MARGDFIVDHVIAAYTTYRKQPSETRPELTNPRNKDESAPLSLSSLRYTVEIRRFSASSRGMP